MKRIGSLFLSFLLCMPLVVRAADHCTNPEEYTIDKRCYVTDEQKKEKPYNAVAMIVGQHGSAGSGTIVKRQGLTQDDVGYFLYTAKHCTDKNNDHIADDILRIRLPSGQEFDAKLISQGNYDFEDSATNPGDWAKYRLLMPDKNSNAKAVLNGAYVKINGDLARGAHDVRIIGYGRLKIMSDQDIEDFRTDYLNFAENLYWGEDMYTEMLDGGLVGAGIHMFVANHFHRFEDDELKVSYCSQNAHNEFYECQGWGGNSGGGAFDENGNLMWIVTLGNYQIGGDNHAAITGGINFLSFGRLAEEQK